MLVADLMYPSVAAKNFSSFSPNTLQRVKHLPEIKIFCPSCQIRPSNFLKLDISENLDKIQTLAVECNW